MDTGARYVIVSLLVVAASMPVWSQSSDSSASDTRADRYRSSTLDRNYNTQSRNWSDDGFDSDSFHRTYLDNYYSSTQGRGSGARYGTRADRYNDRFDDRYSLDRRDRAIGRSQGDEWDRYNQSSWDRNTDYEGDYRWEDYDRSARDRSNINRYEDNYYSGNQSRDSGARYGNRDRSNMRGSNPDRSDMNPSRTGMDSGNRYYDDRYDTQPYGTSQSSDQRGGYSADRFDQGGYSADRFDTRERYNPNAPRPYEFDNRTYLQDRQHEIMDRHQSERQGSGQYDDRMSVDTQDRSSRSGMPVWDDRYRTESSDRGGYPSGDYGRYNSSPYGSQNTGGWGMMQTGRDLRSWDSTYDGRYEDANNRV